MQTLLVIDRQDGMRDRIRAGRGPINPGARNRIAALPANARGRGVPVIHVHHHDPASPFRMGAPMPCAAPLAGKTMFWKHASSAFAETGLYARLRGPGGGDLVVAGVVAVFGVTSTVRMGSDLVA